MDVRYRPTMHQGHQGFRFQSRRARHGLQAHRSRLGPIAGVNAPMSLLRSEPAPTSRPESSSSGRPWPPTRSLRNSTCRPKNLNPQVLTTSPVEVRHAIRSSVQLRAREFFAAAIRSASSLTSSRDFLTARSQGRATRAAQHRPMAQRSAPISPE